MFWTSPRFPVLSLLQWGGEPGSGAKRDVSGRGQVTQSFIPSSKGSEQGWDQI